jgi:hypothetical protein
MGGSVMGGAGGNAMGGAGGNMMGGAGGKAMGGAGGKAGSGASGAAGSGTAGMGGMGMSCPAAAPMEGTMCNDDTNPDPCRYATSVCECGGAPMGPDGTWTCSDCPATSPMDGSPCDNAINDQCDYGQVSCDCGRNDTWNCR